MRSSSILASALITLFPGAARAADLKTVQSTGLANAYNNGVTNNGIQSGTLTFVVPNDAPATLFYDCSIHASMAGVIQVSSPVPGAGPITAGALLLLSAGVGAVALRRRARS